MLLVTLARWVNRQQQHVIEYLVEENRVLKEQVKGRRLGQRVRQQVATFVTPNTILRWHRPLSM